MRIRLHWKILVATVVPLLGLTGAALWTVNRSLSEHANHKIRDDLVLAASLFEDMLATRAEELVVASQVIVQDPKFFSVLTLPHSDRDPEVRATAEGVASDFNAITHADLFLVFDAAGNLLADASREPVRDADARPLLRELTLGRPSPRVLVSRGFHFQVTVTPVLAGPRIVGALVLGARIGPALAERLRSLTRSEVTFFSAGIVTGSTLQGSEDRVRLAELLSRRGGSTPPGGIVFDWTGASSTYVTVARAIPGSSPGEAQLYVIQRSLQAETAFLAPIRLALLEIGLIALVVSLAVGYLVSRGITAPVRTLVRGAEAMERGNYDYPLEVRTGDEIGYLALRFRDMRQQQRVYVRSLEEVARLKGDFIDVASHELRTPLSILKGFLELLAHERLGPLTPHQREAVAAMNGGVATLTRIAEDAGRMAQIQSERLTLAPGAHEVDSLLQEAVDRACVAGRGRSVSLDLQPAAVEEPVFVDGPRLVEAVYHLACNGIRFTPDGGRVTIRARVQGEDVLVDVEDTGIGISQEALRGLLERSMILRDPLNHHSSSLLEFNSAGLGLGIPIARGVAEAHGGGLTAESVPGRGSRFTLRIPLRGAALREAA